MTPVLSYAAYRFSYRILAFVEHWYWGSFRLFGGFLIELLRRLDRTFAVRITLRHFFQPLYQDRTIIGYILGFIFRSLRIAIALPVYLLIIAITALIYLLWLIIPLYLLYRTKLVVALGILVLVVLAVAARKFINFAEASPFLMSYASRMTLRIVSSVWLVIQTAGTVILFISDITWLFWLGVLSALYLVDRLLHYNQAPRSLTEPLDDVNISWYLTPKTEQALMVAYDRVTLLGGNFYLNLAKILLEEETAKEALERLEVNLEEFSIKLDDYLARKAGYREDRQKIISRIEELIRAAYNQKKKDQRFISQAELFAALGEMEDEDLKALFGLFEVEPGALDRVVVFGRLHRRLGGFFPRAKINLGNLFTRPSRPRHRVMNRAWTARPTPLLDQLSTDFTDLARTGRIGLLVGHQEELNRLIDVLSRSTKPNALLVGEPSSGKETIIEHLAYRIIHDQVPPQLFDKRLVALDIGALVAGALQGEIQGRIGQIFNEIARAGNIVLYIPEIHNLSRTAEPKQLTAAHTILPLIISNEFPTVGTTFPREFKQLIEPDSLFTEAFEVIRVNEVTSEEAELILAYRSLILEHEYKVRITYEAIRTAVRLGKRYFRPKLLPASADDLLKEAVADARNKEEKVLRSDGVIEVAERKTNVPIRQVDQEEASHLINLEELIRRRLINQEEAVKAVADALREYRSGLTQRKGPIGVFLFVGPTGVGKTELAKILAEIQFGQEEAMIRFDMSAFQTKESLYRFIGSPDGVSSGALTDAVLERPYSLILLDEFEKAHPDIWNVFLPLFDEGRLTDNLGRVVDFTNTIIIATSNAHSDIIHRALRGGESMRSITEYLKKALVDIFNPELLNRFGDIIVFRDLGPIEIGAIVKLQLADLARLLKESRGVDLEYSEEVINLLAKRGYEPAFGARPLARVIRDELKEPLSKKLLSGEIKRGSKVRVDAVGEEIVISSSL